MTADSTPNPEVSPRLAQSDAPNSAPDGAADGGASTTGGLTQVLAQGMRFDARDPAALAAALDLAMDYRGDVSLMLHSGASVDGYIYDRRRTPPRSLRILPRDAERGMLVRDDEIALLDVTGRDTAAGKTFENWVRRYLEKKLAGEQASIESESLEE